MAGYLQEASRAAFSCFVNNNGFQNLRMRHFTVYDSAMTIEDTLEGLKHDKLAEAGGYSFYQSRRVVHPVTCPGLYELRPQFHGVCHLPYVLLDDGTFAMSRGGESVEDIEAACVDAGLCDKEDILAIPTGSLARL